MHPATNNQQRPSHLPLLALLGGAAAISLAPIFVRISEVGPLATAFWRLLLAWPTLWLWMTRDGRGTPSTRRPLAGKDYWRLSLAGFFFAGDLSIWHTSLGFTSVANATLLVNYAPLWVTLGSWWLFQERIKKVFLAGMISALAGATLIMGESLQIRLDQMWGDLLALIASIFYAGYLLSIKHLRRDFSTAIIMNWTTAGSMVLVLLVTLMSGENFFAISFQGWLVLIGLALISQVAGQGLITFSLAQLPAAFSSVTLLSQPVMATVFAWITLNEGLSSRQLAGGLLVLVGIFLARKANG